MTKSTVSFIVTCTRTQNFIETVDHISPELPAGSKNTAGSNIYFLGVSVYEITFRIDGYP